MANTLQSSPKEISYPQAAEIVSEMYNLMHLLKKKDKTPLESYKSALAKMDQGGSQVDKLKNKITAMAGILQGPSNSLQSFVGLAPLHKKFRENNFFALAEGKENAVVIKEPSLQDALAHFKETKLPMLQKKATDFFKGMVPSQN